MTDVKDTGPLDWRIAIVGQDGRPTPEFQRRWSTQRANNALIGSITLGSGVPTTIPEDGAEYIDISVTPYVLYVGNNKTWHQTGPIKFTELSDVPHTYVSSAGKFAQVNPGATALQFSTAVTSIIAGTGLSGGTITTTGTIALANTAVTPGSYTNVNLTVDAQGRITAAANGSSGVVGANPTATIGTAAVNGTAVTFMRSDAAPAFGNLTGADVTSIGMATTLSNTAVTAGSYSNPNITVDAKGRITAASNGSAAVPYLPLCNGDPTTPDTMFGNAMTISVPLTTARMDTRIVNFIATGVIASRPTTPIVPTGGSSAYLASDTSKFYIWSGSTWVQTN